ncbi:MAG: hypothetical protein HKN35_13390 [Woeseia sp.]|nr:hypothetical protein [Woeseia sp.]MBT8095840.1 hypothetical protein [Woeseia sp.]NNE61883.1 hypothetical protein [Woeseia sp.]NNL55094.1 hypothetical protein [Woeseia sp.]
MLAALQDQLSDLYQLDTGYHIDDFLITDPEVARILGADSMLVDNAETVLLSEDESGVALSVYLDEDVLERLRSKNPLEGLEPDQLDDYWTVLEGVSHFNYLAFSAQQDKSVTLLELEMQAEVDKFVSALRLALAQEDHALAKRLHSWLFDEVSFHPDLDAEQRERYRAASDYAARFCHRLGRRLTGGGKSGLDELRHFYRLTQSRKISHIHSQAWST